MSLLRSIPCYASYFTHCYVGRKLALHQANADLEKEIVIHGKDRFLIDSDLVNAVKKAPLITETHVNSSGEEVSIVNIYIFSLHNTSKIDKM